MRPMLIGPHVRERIAEVIAYAEAHRFSLHDLHRIMVHPEQAAGTNPAFVVEVPMGFKVVFTIEEQPMGLSRHLSVSVDGENWPNEIAVQELGREFGFKTPYEKWLKYLEKESRAVSVLELYEQPNKGEG